MMFNISALFALVFLFSCSVFSPPVFPSAKLVSYAESKTVRVTCGNATATGVVYNADTVITANHVLPADRDCSPSAGGIDAKVVARNVRHDVAILRLEKNLNTRGTIKLGNPRIGQPVIVLGFPRLIGFTVSPHPLSVTSGVVATSTNKWLRITAQFFFGSSGGGVWDENGKLIGIVSQLPLIPILTLQPNLEYRLDVFPVDGHYWVSSVDVVKDLLKELK